MNRLPKPENRSKFHEEMFNRHSHAEIEYLENPGKIVYTEKDVLKLLRLVKREVLTWAAENAKVKINKTPYISMRTGDTLYHQEYVVDKQSILKGKKNKKLKI
jgi:hypothetical protein